MSDFLIDPNEPRLRLDLPEMDDTHLEFIDLVNRLAGADKTEFITLFAELVEHTQQHFAHELEMMEQCRFPAIREHNGEHQRVLGDMNRIGTRVAAGSVAMGRAYVKELPSWFGLHALTMDSALAGHWKATQVQSPQPNPLVS